MGIDRSAGPDPDDERVPPVVLIVLKRRLRSHRITAPPMKRASPRLPVLAAGRIGGALIVLLLAGCAVIERSPQRDAPPPVPPRATAAAEPHVAATASPAGPPPSALSADRDAPGATEQKTSKPAAPTAQAPATAAAKSPEKSPGESTVKAPPKPAASPPATAQLPKPQTPAPALAKPAGPPPLDLKSLEARLKETKAIGVFTKLTLKNQIDDLLDRFRAYYQGRLQTSLAELRRSFDMLVLKTVALLQDADPPLARAIVSSRESIWGILSNPATFATG
jgi:hypothetical protein